MPYRRLPNTDTARHRALSRACEMGRSLPPFKLAFSQSTFQHVQSFLGNFETAMSETKQAYQNQVNRNHEYLRALKKAKLYISHFIQVVNMAIMRGDLQESERNYFGMHDDTSKLPNLNAESDIIKWGEKLIHGEYLRRTKGLSPITNPTIAVVRVRYEQFLDAYKFQKTLQKNYQRAQEHLASMRNNADAIILDVWNEVEASYDQFDGDEKRANAKQYGIAYVFRKNELRNIADQLNKAES